MLGKIYAYTTDEAEKEIWNNREGRGLIKVGYTTQTDVRERILQQLQGVPNKQYTLLLEVPAIDKDNNDFTDHKVHAMLKSMGCYRIPGTEWFECTLEELKQALQKVKSGEKPVTRLTKHNTPNSEELNLITPSNIINVMRIYPEQATSLRKIGELFKNRFNIVNYSSMTLANKISDVVKALQEAGTIINEGTMNNPILKLSTVVDEIPYIPTRETKQFTIDDLEMLVITNPTGRTLAELNKLTNVCKSSIQFALSANPNVRVVWVQQSGFNGYIQKYYSTKAPIKLEDNEVIVDKFVYDDTVELPDKAAAKITEILKHSYKDGMCLRTIKSKSKGLTIDMIMKCIKEQLPEFEVVGFETAGEYAKVYRQKYVSSELEDDIYNKASVKHSVVSKALDKEIYDFINTRNGITSREICGKLHLSNATWSSAVKRMTNVYRYKKKNTSSGLLEFFYYTTPQVEEKEPTEYMLSHLDTVTINTLVRACITDEILEEVINKHSEGIRRDPLMEELKDITNTSYTISHLWNVCRPLITEMVRDGRVTNNPASICRNRRGWLLFPGTETQDKIAQYYTVGKKTDEVVCELLKEYPYGVTLRIACTKMGMTSQAFTAMFQNSNMLKRHKIHDTYSDTTLYRYYRDGDEPRLRDGEVIVE